MLEYEQLNHMEKIPRIELPSQQSVYLSHHAAFKQTSQSTKIRIVFNASRASSNKTSLNDYLLVRNCNQISSR